MVKRLLKDLGYDNGGIEKIINWYSNSLEDTLYGYIIDTFNYLELKGYSEKDIVKMTKKSPILFGYSEKNIEDKFKYLELKGYSEKDIVKMSKKLPSLFGYSEKNIEDKFKYLELKGYSKKDIVKMTKQFPALFSFSQKNIEDKFKYLELKGYSEKDIVKMTKQLSTLFGLSEENIDKKIEFYKEINLEFIIINDTMRLMQSIELTNARYNFFTDLGIIINQDNYIKLFYNQKTFTKRFGITNKELLERYPYNQKKLIKEV